MRRTLAFHIFSVSCRKHTEPDELKNLALSRSSTHIWCLARFGTICTIFVQQPATLLKLTLLHGCFSRFLNCTNGTKSRNAPQLQLKNCPGRYFFVKSEITPHSAYEIGVKKIHELQAHICHAKIVKAGSYQF